MAYKLATGETLPDGIRRILSEQLERSLVELADAKLGQAAKIHQLRKRCKKIRGALRLVRGALKTYSMENAWYRDAARSISDVRDAQVMLETCDELAQRFGDQVDAGTMHSIRQRLETRRDELTADPGRIDDRLCLFETAMVAGLQRVDSLDIEPVGHGPALEGMCKTYARARLAMKAACDSPVPEAFHRWRKPVKYHGYHMRILCEAWPTVVRARRNEVDALGDLLGEHHDLSVLRAWVLNEQEPLANQEGLTSFTKLVDERSAQIEEACQSLGDRLFAEKPKHLQRRFSAYLDAWSR